MISATVAFIHFVAAFVVVKSVFDERSLVNRLTDQSFESLDFVKVSDRLQRINRLGGVAVAILFVAGLLRVFFFGKGISFYMGSVFFWLKLILFIAAGLVAVLNTRHYAQVSKLSAEPVPDSPANSSVNQQQAPDEWEQEIAQIHKYMNLQIGLFAGVALCACLMAAGVGSAWLIPS